MELKELLKGFDLPKGRINELSPDNLRWIKRNIQIRNSANPLLNEAIISINKALKPNAAECEHIRFTAYMDSCPDCGFECEHDRAFWTIEDNTFIGFDGTGMVKGGSVAVFCSRDNVEVTEIAEDQGE